MVFVVRWRYQTPIVRHTVMAMGCAESFLGPRLVVPGVGCMHRGCRTFAARAGRPSKGLVDASRKKRRGSGSAEAQDQAVEVTSE